MANASVLATNTDLRDFYPFFLLPTRPALSQFQSLRIRRSAVFMQFRSVVQRICEAPKLCKGRSSLRRHEYNSSEARSSSLESDTASGQKKMGDLMCTYEEGSKKEKKRWGKSRPDIYEEYSTIGLYFTATRQYYTWNTRYILYMMTHFEWSYGSKVERQTKHGFWLICRFTVVHI